MARTCHCSASVVSCQPDGKCQSPLISADNSFFCLVTRRYNQFSGEYINHQQCILDILDYGLYCSGPRVEGLVFQVSICRCAHFRVSLSFYVWCLILNFDCLLYSGKPLLSIAITACLNGYRYLIIWNWSVKACKLIALLSLLVYLF